jgi:hypothetical protein
LLRELAGSLIGHAAPIITAVREFSPRLAVWLAGGLSRRPLPVGGSAWWGRSLLRIGPASALVGLQHWLGLRIVGGRLDGSGWRWLVGSLRRHLAGENGSGRGSAVSSGMSEFGEVGEA